MLRTSRKKELIKNRKKGQLRKASTKKFGSCGGDFSRAWMFQGERFFRVRREKWFKIRRDVHKVPIGGSGKSTATRDVDGRKRNDPRKGEKLRQKGRAPRPAVGRNPLRGVHDRRDSHSLRRGKGHRGPSGTPAAGVYWERREIKIPKDHHGKGRMITAGRGRIPRAMSC